MRGFTDATAARGSNDANAAVFGPELWVSADERARQNPGTFGTPSPAAVAGIGPGSCVKISDGLERFWVRVHSVETAGGKLALCGEIDNNLLGGQDYHLGSLVRFEGKHIFEVFVPRT